MAAAVKQKPKVYEPYIVSQVRQLKGEIRSITDVIPDFNKRKEAEVAVANLVLRTILKYNPERGVASEIEDLLECVNDKNSNV